MLVISECGINHSGNLETALQLIKVSKEANADIVKFATFKANNLVPRSSKDWQFWNDLEFRFSEWQELKLYADKLGIEFMSTPSHPDDVKLLERLNVKRYKIGSDDIDNFPLLDAVADTGKPIFVSTGNASYEEIELAKYRLNTRLSLKTIMYCVSKYPCSLSDLNLFNGLRNIRTIFNGHVGYSNHLSDYDDTLFACISALSLGAEAIEVHVKLINDCPDSNISLCPEDLKELIYTLNEIEDMLHRKEPPEQVNSRKRLHTNKRIKEGEKLSVELLRSEVGLPASCFYKVSNLTATRNMKRQEPINHWDVLWK